MELFKVLCQVFVDCLTDMRQEDVGEPFLVAVSPNKTSFLVKSMKIVGSSLFSCGDDIVVVKMLNVRSCWGWLTVRRLIDTELFKAGPLIIHKSLDRYGIVDDGMARDSGLFDRK